MAKLENVDEPTVVPTMSQRYLLPILTKQYTSIDPKWHGKVPSIFRNLFQTDPKYTYSQKDISGQKRNINADICYMI